MQTLFEEYKGQIVQYSTECTYLPTRIWLDNHYFTATSSSLAYYIIGYSKTMGGISDLYYECEAPVV